MQNPLLKCSEDLDEKTLKDGKKEFRNRPRSVEQRLFTPKLHLDPILNQFRSNELQKMKMLCPLYSDVLDASLCNIVRLTKNALTF